MAGATVSISTSPYIAMGLALFYDGLIQILAGLFELILGNNFHAFIFCSYASTFNFLSGVIDTSVQYKALNVFYVGWTIFTLAMLIASIRINVALIIFLFFFFMSTDGLVTASYFLLWDQNMSCVGGAVGIFTAAIAWYAGFGSLIRKGVNSYFNLPVFILSPRSQAVLTEESTAEVHEQKI
ncbi:unnamed protein product [Rotaria sordida]|uniref:Uncharacterized protein n=1 Tax=Rotaria sordida TaxID=392033 RepID=A0A815SEH4_9BILA|nr:unnamed protein product [Rotaria sordida]CAF1491750.1 unnamed protein product [Rotaria sordida]